MKIPMFHSNDWDKLVRCGVSADELAKKCYDKTIVEDRDMIFFLERGTSPELVFSMALGYFNTNRRPEELIRSFSILRQYNLPVDSINEWIHYHLNKTLISSIVKDNTDDWEKLGVDASSYVGLWIIEFGDSYFDSCFLEDLPGKVPLERFISSYRMERILELTEPYDFSDFICEYLEAGGDIDVLARKYVDEIGYSGEPERFMPMFDLIASGASVIDPERFVQSIDTEKLDEIDLTYLCDGLKAARFSRELMDKLFPA